MPMRLQATMPMQLQATMLMATEPATIPAATRALLIQKAKVATVAMVATVATVMAAEAIWKASLGTGKDNRPHLRAVVPTTKSTTSVMSG